jgi:hypothetical protein
VVTTTKLAQAKTAATNTVGQVSAAVQQRMNSNNNAEPATTNISTENTAV